MNSSGHLSHLDVLDDDAPIYLIKVKSQSSIQVRTWEGKRLSLCLCRSSLGKCLLAWSGRERQDMLIRSIVFTDGLPNTITDEGQLRAELQKIRETDWAYDNEEDVANIRCISAPVFNAVVPHPKMQPTPLKMSS